MDMLKMGAYLKKLRSEKDLTQEELASILNVSFASVNRWEHGYHEPTMKVKRKLRDLFIQNNIWEDEKNE